MPFEIEKDGQTIKVWTQEEVNSEVAGLKVTNQQLKDEKKALGDKLKDIDEAKRTAEEEKAKAEGDYEKLNQLMLERQQSDTERYNKLVGDIKREKVTNALNDVVTELGAGGTKNEDLRDLIKARFEFDLDQETNSVTVSGEGVAGLDQLKESIKNSERYAAYIAGSQASGGGSQGSSSTGGADKKFSEYTPGELSQIQQDDPAKYERIRATR